MILPSNSTQVRESNIRMLLKTICDNGPLSKRELQQKTELSWGTVSSLTAILQHCGYLVTVGKQETLSGRKPEELDINPHQYFVVGIDLNIAGMCGVVTDMRGRVIKEWMRLFAQMEHDCILTTLTALLDDIFSEYSGKKILGIGVAVQGEVNVQNGVSVWLPQVSNWYNVPLRSILEQRYHCSVLLEHDPNCLMVAESVYGTPLMADVQDTLLIRIDQGIGMSIMSNGQLHRGVNGLSGELGHIVIDPDGPLCECGNKGCLGCYVSGGGLLRRLIEEVNRNRHTLLAAENLQTLSYREVATAALNGDVLSRELFETMGEKLGLALSTLYNIFNVDIVIIYGDMCRYRELFLRTMQENLQAHIFRKTAVKLVFSELGKNSAAQGAALLLSRHFVQTMDFKELTAETAKES